MKYDRRAKPHLAASADRLHMTGVSFDVERKRLVATNGHILAVVPCKPDAGDTPGLLPAKAFASAVGKVLAGPEFAEAPEGTLYRRCSTEESNKFPPVDQAIPKFRPGNKGTLTIALDPKLLLTLAEAIGALDAGDRFVTLTVKVPSKPERFRDTVLVLPGTDGDKDTRGIGVLMPAMTTVEFKGPFADTEDAACAVHDGTVSR